MKKRAFLLDGYIDIPSQPNADSIIAIHNNNVICISDWMYIFPKLDLKKGGRFLPNKSVITTIIKDYELTYNVWEETDVYELHWMNNKIVGCGKVSEDFESKVRLQHVNKSEYVEILTKQSESDDLDYSNMILNKLSDAEDQFLLIYSAEDKKELIDIMEYIGTPTAGISYDIVSKRNLSNIIENYNEKTDFEYSKKMSKLKALKLRQANILNKYKSFLNGKN